jgi:hypothetical protein
MSRKWGIMIGTEGAKDILIFNISDLYFLARNAMFSCLENVGSMSPKYLQSTLRQISEGRNL